jgi:O-antigen biosynthesis protein
MGASSALESRRLLNEISANVETVGRPTVRGKFLFDGDAKLYVRGVTYGTFAPGPDGTGYPVPSVVDADFLQMAANGINAVRTYTVPPRWLLDVALRRGLRVMVGLPWEQHVAFLEERARAGAIERRVREGVRACADHPAVLCYAVGNEISAPIVRWHGARRVERFIRRLYEAAKDEDPGGLVTYVNYPTTEYLQLPFLDFLCFNVYLEARDRLEAYLARLQNVAGDRPLVMGEIGLDSRAHGESGQARSLEWQLDAAFESGCAGAFVFAWTDEWHRGGHEIDDWDFGVTDRGRRAKPALHAVRGAFASAPFGRVRRWPRISVIVCSHNGGSTLRDCFEGLSRLDYPDYEVIVVDDGSTDGGIAIAEDYGFCLIRTPNRGLGSARNTGLEAATGEIVAYIDDDAYPDPHWLRYLAAGFAGRSHAGIGGPNIPPLGDGTIADCVAASPGRPIHVLLSDEEAEHIPGCNMAFRRHALAAIGGFDPRFRAAGDDVDVCWRLQERGWTLGFSPAALVWHHARNSIRAYWKQQRGYGRAEAILERKWPEKYNGAGHLEWRGRLYGDAGPRALWPRRHRIYQGVWGSGPFQRLYEEQPPTIAALTLMPEWYLVVGLLAVLCGLGLLWAPLLLTLPLLAAALALPTAQALASARACAPVGRALPLALTAFLHLTQPVMRLRGRLRHGLTPWRLRGLGGIAVPAPCSWSVWSERWLAAEDWVGAVERGLTDSGAIVQRGGVYDGWDLHVRGGMFGAGRLLAAVEEHGAGRQLIRFRWRPQIRAASLVLILLCVPLAGGAAAAGAWPAAAIGVLVALAGTATATLDCARATAAVRAAIAQAASATEDRVPEAPAPLIAAREVSMERM